MIELNRGIEERVPGPTYLKEVETSRIHINQNLSGPRCGLWNACGEGDIRRVGKLFHDECPHGVCGSKRTEYSTYIYNSRVFSATSIGGS